MRIALALVVLAAVAHADATPPTPAAPPARRPVELGALHCDGVAHRFTVEVDPGETTFVWRGDRGCEGAEATAAPLDRLARRTFVAISSYDGGAGVVRLVVQSHARGRVRLRISLFGAYA